jgi:carbonic anhydrase
MARSLLSLLLGVSALRRGLDLSHRSRALQEPFADLSACQTAYDQLKTKYDELKAKHDDLVKECKPEQEPPTPEPVTVEPEADNSSAGERRPISTQIGEPTHKDGRPLYRPPMSDTGKPDAAHGYDYRKHGEDWTQFATCQALSGQSPVDFPKAIDIHGQTKSLLWFDYFLDDKVSAASEMPLINAGHGLYANLDTLPIEYGFVKLLKTEYKVHDVVFHTPSEHTIEGKHYPLEIQIYHKARNDPHNYLGVSIMFTEGESNPYLAAMKQAAPTMPVWTAEGSAGKVVVSGEFSAAFDLENVLPTEKIHPGGDLTFYNYEGSVTHPPCSTGVDWWVLANPMTATKDELSHVSSAITHSESTKDGNNRKVQSMGDRKITIGHTGFQHHGTGHRKPGKQFPRQERGYSTQDHPWRKPEKAHWAAAAEAAAWKDGADKKVEGQAAH